MTRAQTRMAAGSVCSTMRLLWTCQQLNLLGSPFYLLMCGVMSSGLWPAADTDPSGQSTHLNSYKMGLAANAMQFKPGQLLRL